MNKYTRFILLVTTISSQYDSNYFPHPAFLRGFKTFHF